MLVEESLSVTHTAHPAPSGCSVQSRTPRLTPTGPLGRANGRLPGGSAASEEIAMGVTGACPGLH